MRAWRIESTQADGTVDIEPNTMHSYGWSRGSGYAQLYLYVGPAQASAVAPKQSGIKTGGWLDGQPFNLADDPNPPAGFSTSPGAQINKLLQGLTPKA